MALQHKSTWRFSRELKREIGLEDYLEYVKGTSSRFFKSFFRVPMGCLRSLVDMLTRMGQGSVLIVVFVRSWLSKFFLNVHRIIPTD